MNHQKFPQFSSLYGVFLSDKWKHGNHDKEYDQDDSLCVGEMCNYKKYNDCEG